MVEAPAWFLILSCYVLDGFLGLRPSQNIGRDEKDKVAIGLPALSDRQQSAPG